MLRAERAMKLITASRMGEKHTENQDRVLARRLNETSGLIAVADGMGGTPYGGSVARWLIENHLEVDELPLEPGRTASVFRAYLETLSSQFRAEFFDLPEMLSSGATLSVVAFVERQAECFWVGDSPIFATTGKTLQTRLISTLDRGSRAHVLTDWFGGRSPFDLKHASVSNAAILTICSDGVVSDPGELNRMWSRGFTQASADELVDRCVAVPGSDDASIAAVAFE